MTARGCPFQCAGALVHLWIKFHPTIRVSCVTRNYPQVEAYGYYLRIIDTFGITKPWVVEWARDKKSGLTFQYECWRGSSS